MLPPEHRLRSRVDFSEVVRQGSRASRPLLTVHLLTDGPPDSPVRAGLVVSKAVGGSVQRHRTSRRLRHLLREHVMNNPSGTAGPVSFGALPPGALPPGSRLVVRAGPKAGAAQSSALRADLTAAVGAAVRTSTGRGVTRG